MRLKTLKIIFGVLVTVWIISGIGYALTTWSGTISWTVESEQFSVWDSAVGGSEIASPYAPASTVLTIGVHTYDFYLQNDGNVPINVTATTVGTPVNCTASWSGTPAGVYTVPTGTTRVLATLTLNVSGGGSYDWNFQVS